MKGTNMSKYNVVPPQVRQVCRIQHYAGLVHANDCLPARYRMRFEGCLGDGYLLYSVRVSLDGGGCWAAKVVAFCPERDNVHTHYTVAKVETKGRAPHTKFGGRAIDALCRRQLRLDWELHCNQ
jgi:hypothetical protein